MYKILIVEDDRGLNQGITLALEREDTAFLRAHAAGEAREMLEREQVDMALLDVNLPDGSGYDLLKEIRSHSKIPVLGIPAGLVLGFFIGKWIVPLVLARSAYAGGEVEVSLNPFIFLGAVLFTLVTVGISTRKPARIAARVSPVEAVRYTEGAKGRRKEKRTTDGGKLWRMALSGLGRS